MIDPNHTYAVIGASTDTNKYGYKVFKDLLQANYKVIPINPNQKTPILEQRVYPTLSDYPYKIDVAIFVVPPSVTQKVLHEVLKLQIPNVRLQPGAESSQAIDFCKQNNINCTHNACIMIMKNK